MENQNSKKCYTGEECGYCAITEEYEGVGLKKCSVCLLVSYCSKECQRLHWNKGGHKLFCISPEARKASLFKQRESFAEEEVCIICSAQRLSTEEQIQLPCGHKFHVHCLITSDETCFPVLCSKCRASFPQEEKRNIPLNDAAVTLWSDTLTAFKDRTGHSMDCVHSGCHNLNEREKQSLTQLKTMYTEAALLSNSTSARLLGMLYQRGLGVAFPKDYKLSQFWLHLAIDMGSMDLECPFLRGLMYIEGGYGLDLNQAKGKEFLRLAADKGHDGAQFFLGTIMRSGKNMQERQEGVRLLQLSASQQNIEALCDVGMIQFEGNLCERSFEKAFFLFHASAERGMSLGMYLLSGCYARGHGVLQNDQKAALWLSKAEEHGNQEMCEFVTKWFKEHAP
jgi:TPR repeat protein